MYAQTLFNQQSYTGNVGTLLNFIYKNGLKFLILIPSYILVVYVCDTILRNLCYKSHIWKFFRGGGRVPAVFHLFWYCPQCFSLQSLLHPPKGRDWKYASIYGGIAKRGNIFHKTSSVPLSRREKNFSLHLEIRSVYKNIIFPCSLHLEKTLRSSPSSSYAHKSGLLLHNISFM